MEHTFPEDVLPDEVPSNGNLVLALIAGLAAAVVGSLVWMGITLAAGWHVGYVALGIGALVGLAIRFAGRGSHIIYGVMGVVFTLLSCLVGEIGVAIQSATTPQFDFYAVLMRVDLAAMVANIITQTSPMMAVVYAVGLLEAYKLSIRK